MVSFSMRPLAVCDSETVHPGHKSHTHFGICALSATGCAASLLARAHAEGSAASPTALRVASPDIAGYAPAITPILMISLRFPRRGIPPARKARN